jgi:hypothetical protein
MKRLLLITALILSGSVAAHADTSSWTAKTPRSDGELFAAGRACNAQVGPELYGLPTSAAYKKCMASYGWRYLSSTRDNTWTNHRGMHCQPILNGLGSECDAVW